MGKGSTRRAARLQYDADDRAGLHRNTVSNFETGKFAGDLDTVQRISARWKKPELNSRMGSAWGALEEAVEFRLSF
jgi:hypothetical protein